MVGTNLKAETSSLMDKRSALESEMNSIIARLSQPGAPGLSGNLVDSEGFPRSDIDVHLVRAERRRLAELRNDYMEITKKIDQNVQILLSPRPPNDISGTQTSSTVEALASTPNVLPTLSSNLMDVDVLVSRPFAVVDEISDASPAVEDGLQLGDQILKFGNVEAGENLLPRLASESHSNMGQAVPVVIMRQGTVINLTITPRAWPGRGLLGCHFRIL